MLKIKTFTVIVWNHHNMKYNIQVFAILVWLYNKDWQILEVNTGKEISWSSVCDLCALRPSGQVEKTRGKRKKRTRSTFTETFCLLASHWLSGFDHDDYPYATYCQMKSNDCKCYSFLNSLQWNPSSVILL